MSANRTMSAAEFDAIDPTLPFCRDYFVRMSVEQVNEFWRRRQVALRDAGKDHYTHLVDPVTDEIVVAI